LQRMNSRSAAWDRDKYHSERKREKGPGTLLSRKISTPYRRWKGNSDKRTKGAVSVRGKRASGGRIGQESIEVVVHFV
jgi:hypothetical protein